LLLEQLQGANARRFRQVGLDGGRFLFSIQKPLFGRLLLFVLAPIIIVRMHLHIGRDLRFFD
jgi:hypothetical protein